MTRLPLMFACLLSSFAAAASAAVAGDIPCEAQPSLRSNNSNTPTKITFVNKTSQGRTILWLDFNGNPTQYSWLEPGQKFSIDTFLTHPWLITDGPGNCIEIYMPTAKARTINLKLEPDFGGGD